MTDIQTEMPADVLYGKVVGRFILAVADQGDDGRLPDAVPAQGNIIFTPLIPNRKMVDPQLTTVVAQAIRCTLDGAGQLKDPEGEVGVWLLTGQYRVTYQLQNATIPNHVIDVTVNHIDSSPLDLTSALPPAGPGITPTQYTTLLAMIQAIQIPVLSVNGETGEIVLGPSEVGTYSQEQIDEMFANLGFPVVSVNGETGNITLAAADVGTYDADYIDEQLQALGGVIRGTWNSSFTYKYRDMVTIDGVLWYATEENQNVRPVSGVTINPAGGDGGPGNYTLEGMYGNANQVAHPIRVNRDVLVASISLLVHASQSGLPAGKIGIMEVKPVQGASGPAVTITEPTEFDAEVGPGWHAILLDDPILLAANTDYWVLIDMPTGVGPLNGQWDFWQYQAPMVAPTDHRDTRRVTGSSWDYHVDRHTYVQLGEKIPKVWEPLADYTPSQGDIDFPVDSVNGQTGAVVLNADDVGSLTAEQIRDLIGTVLVEGENITIDVDDTAETITISSTGGGGTGDGVFAKWRGVWSGLQLIQAVNPSEVGLNPPVELTRFGLAADSPTFGVISKAAATTWNGVTLGGATPNSGMVYKAGAKSNGWPGGSTSRLEIPAPAGTTEVRFKYAAGMGVSNYGAARLTVAGVIIKYSQEADWAWTAYTRSISPGEKVRIEGLNPYGGTNIAAEAYLADLEFYGPAAAYVLGDLVFYNGQFYQCASAGTGSVPGTDGAWTPLTLNWPKLYSLRISADSTTADTPTSPTVVPGPLRLTNVPGNCTALISFSVLHTGPHPNHHWLYVDGVAEQELDAGYSTTDTGAYVAQMVNIPVTLGPGTHTIEVQHNASVSTAGITFKDRWITAQCWPNA